jgi:TolA-binding protein
MKKAEIRMKQGQFSHAESLYLEVINDHGDGILADDALFNLANLYRDNIKDNVKAMAMYQDLMMKHPGSLYTFEARKLFRSLRGDQIQ